MARNILDDWQQACEVLDRAEVLHLALCGPDGPYCVPLNFARSGRSLYLHSGLRGRKLELMAADPRVSFTALDQCELKTADTACRLGYRFRSVVGFGTATVVETADERAAGMRTIVEKWSALIGSPGLAMDERVFAAKTAMVRIDVTSATVRIRD